MNFYKDVPEPDNDLKVLIKIAVFVILAIKLIHVFKSCDIELMNLG